jgi:hypothetical protein
MIGSDGCLRGRVQLRTQCMRLGTLQFCADCRFHVLIVDHQQHRQAQLVGDLRRMLEAVIEELTHVDEGNRQQQTGEQAERNDQQRFGERRSVGSNGGLRTRALDRSLSSARDVLLSAKRWA